MSPAPNEIATSLIPLLLDAALAILFSSLLDTVFDWLKPLEPYFLYNFFVAGIVFPETSTSLFLFISPKNDKIRTNPSIMGNIFNFSLCYF